MTSLVPESQVREAFLAACHMELRALKVGNVHVHAGGHGMEVAQFEASAAAAAPFIAAPELSVGARILRGVEASFAAAGCNTNLGILLLCAPLAAACEQPSDGQSFRARLAAVLEALSPQDATDVYRAIAHANPGGLGNQDEDVRAAPTVSLHQAMAMAADRDRIARAYVTDYSDIFEFALPALAEARSQEENEEDSVASLHMSLLAQFPDSHIARKYGNERAESVRASAAALQREIFPLSQSAARDRLLAFDAKLKSERINPGTTADFVVASLFTDKVNRRGRHTAAV